VGSSIRSRGARLAVRERDGCWISKFGYRNSEPSQIDNNLKSKPDLCATAHKNLCVKESSFEVADPAIGKAGNVQSANKLFRTKAKTCVKKYSVFKNIFSECAPLLPSG
jgi:hypothetical protein